MVAITKSHAAKVTANLHNTATQTAQSRQAKTAQNLQRSKACSAVLLPLHHVVMGV